jgi:protein TonB
MTLGRNITVSFLLHMLALTLLVTGAVGRYERYMEPGGRGSALWVELSGGESPGPSGALPVKERTASLSERKITVVENSGEHVIEEVADEEHEMSDETVVAGKPEKVLDEKKKENEALGIYLSPAPAGNDKGGEVAADEAMAALGGGSNNMSEETGGALSAPPIGGQDASSGGGQGSLRDRYIEKIKAAIERAVTYPPLARKRRITGTVVAGFYISGDGRPEDIRVLRSSGHGVLDKETVRIIKRASPFPPLKGRVEVPVRFRLLKGGPS